MTQTTLEGRVALVTGAAQGIGRCVARALAQAGARVALCDLGDDAGEALAEVGPGAVYHRCDVTDPEAVEQMVEQLVEQLGGLHILVNNAGISIDGLLLMYQHEEWRRTLEVNLSGAFNVTKAAARHLLRARKHGRVVNISSVVGETGSAGQLAYAASKAGLLGMTTSLARELAPRGVTVNAVSPGYIITPMTEQYKQTERHEQLMSLIPLGRSGTPEDVAQTVLFLCSPAASYITGQVLRINGGMYM